MLAYTAPSQSGYSISRYNILMTSYPNKGLYAITNNDDSLTNVEAVLNAGARFLQYREKQSPNLDHAKKLRSLCTTYQTRFIINDDPEFALSVKADGVHIGEDDDSYQHARDLLGDDAIIGISCYDSLDLALSAKKLGADYIALGAFFPSQTKQTTRRASIELLIKAKQQLSVPVVAIGGITTENAPPLIAAGVDYIAAINSVFGHEEPGVAAKQFTDLFK